MPTIFLETVINAPIELCFDLARDIDVHQASATKTQEKAVAGVTHGLIGLGETVTWEAVHFCVKQRLTTRITEYNRPNMFTDEMVRGVFNSFSHVHLFRSVPVGTLMVDMFKYTSPMGVIGRIADKLFLQGYMRRFLQQRSSYLKRVAEVNTPLS